MALWLGLPACALAGTAIGWTLRGWWDRRKRRRNAIAYDEFGEERVMPRIWDGGKYHDC